MLSLDARWCSPEGKVLLCVVSALAPLFPPKKTSADYMRAERDYRAQHGSGPVETRGSICFWLAKSIRKARAAGVFNAAELAELDSPIPASAAAKAKSAGAVAAAARVAQPRSAAAKATPAGSVSSSGLGCSSSGSGARSGFDIARPSDPLIAEATEPQVPDPEIDGGELVLDDPPLSGSSTGQESDMTYSATGQAAGGSTTSGAGRGATLSMPGLNVNWPFSQLILTGVKTVEARSYALGYRNIAQPAVEMWLVETPGKANAISKG